MNPRSKSLQSRHNRPGAPALRHPAHAHPRQLVRALAACSLVTFWPGAVELHAQVLPSGMNPVAGQVTARTVGGTLTVNNSPNAIINWNSFSIGAQNAVRFEQNNASSQVLNRVTGKDPSSIFGSLSSNGRVWLLNQNGVLFGQGARVDVASLVTSTLNLADSDFLSGRLRFTSNNAKPAAVVNQGELRSSLGGQIALLGGTVRNEGQVDAPGGQVLLAAGSGIELLDSTTPNVSVRINSLPGEVVNLGRLSAAGGRVDIHAGIVNQDGVVRADSLERGPAGEIVLRASAQLSLGAGSVTAADGDSGGRLTLQGDQALLSGQLSAIGNTGSGGQIKLLGREVGLLDAARIDASGRSGGGEVLVGGGQQGKDTSVPNAQALYFGPKASIAVDAIDSGDGGRVILWSDQATRAFGSLSARGGASGGNGGFIETSGGWLDARPAKVDTAAPHGRAGMWLLDPYDITISDAAIDAGYDASYTATASGSSINSDTISAALASGNVTISTGGANGGLEAGNITLNAANISVGVAAARNLSLNADGAIEATDSSIQSTLGPLGVNFNAALSGPGGIKLYNTTVTTGTGAGGYGNIVFGGAVPGLTPTGGAFNGAGGAVDRGVLLASGSRLDAGSADVTLSGVSSIADGLGVWIRDGSSVAGATVNITGDSLQYRGVELGFNGSGTVSATQAINVLGRGGQLGVGLYGPSVLSLNPTAFDATAQLLVQGQGIGTGDGVQARFNPAATPGISVGNGASLLIEGTAAPGFYGVNLYRAAGIAATNDIDASGGSDMTLRTFGSGDLTIADSRILGAPGINVIGSNQVKLTNAELSSAGSLTVNAGALTLSSSKLTVGVGVAQARSLTLNSDSTIDMFVNSSIASGGGPLDVTFTAARSTDGGIHLDNSTVTTGTVGGGFGNIVFGGPVAGTTPTGAPFTGAGGAVDAGVNLAGSTLNGGAGDVTLSGVSSNAGGHGIWMVGGSSIIGANVSLTGDSSVLRGIEMASGSGIAATHSINLLGRGAEVGVALFGPTLSVLPEGADATAQMLIQGRTLGGVAGIYVDSTAAAAPGITVGNGASLAIEGTPSGPGSIGVWLNRNDAGGPSIDASGGSNMTLRSLGAGQVRVSSSDIVGADGRNNISSDVVVFSDANLTAAGPIAVTANSVSLQGTTQLASSAAGDAIVVSGNNAPVQTFSNTAGNAALSVFDPNEGPPLGRWIVYAASITDPVNFVGGGLVPDFTRHNAAYGGWAGDAGNGLVFSQKQVALSQAAVIPKVYDGNNDANTGPFSLTLGVPTDIVTAIALVGANFSDKYVGTNKQVVGGVSAFSVADQNGKPVYGYTLQQDLRGDITPASLAIVGVSANNKVYDAKTAATLGGAASVNPLPNDVVTVGGVPTADFADKNVGNAKGVSVVGYTLGGADAGNYLPVQPAGLSADITPAPLTGTAVGVNKVYDATTGASVLTQITGGLVGNETVGIANNASFITKDVGNGKPLNVVYQLSDGANGGLASNYVFVPPVGVTADITPASLAIVGVSANNKVYDAKTAATLGGAASVNPLPNDVVTVGGVPTANFADKNVGNAKGVSVVGYTLGGADAGNYLPVQPVGLSADITPAPLVVGGLSATNKVYDASTLAPLSGAPTVNPIAGDTVVVAGVPVGSFLTKDVGAAKNVSVSGLNLAGKDAGNYVPVASNALTADITQAPLLVSGLGAVNKVYDANVAATLRGTATVAPIEGDVVAVSGNPVGSFADKNVGSAKSVAVSGLSLTGKDAGNYRPLASNPLSADITPAPLAVTGLRADNKEYDATLAATLSGTPSVKPLGSDNLVLGGSALAGFSSVDVGSAKAVAVSGYTLGGADAGNYMLLQPSGLFADIRPATLRYLANPALTVTGRAPPALSGSVADFKGTDSMADTSGTLAFSTPVTSLTPPGSYAIDGGGLSARNYVFVQDAANATAMTVGQPADTAVKQSTNVLVVAAVQSVLPPTTTPYSATGGVVDLTQPPAKGQPTPAAGSGARSAGAGATNAFAPVDVASQSQESLVELLATRDLYKKELFAEALLKLEKDPALADLPPCKTMKDVEVGTCLLTESLKRQLQGKPVAALPAQGSAAAAASGAPASQARPAPVDEPQFEAQVASGPDQAMPAQLRVYKRRVMSAALPQIVRKVALVVGVDNYADPSIPQLSNAVNDARAIGRLFDSQLGYETVVLANATRPEVVAAMNRLALELGPQDSVVIYYAGHGEVVDSTKLGYWQLADTDAKRPETWLSNADIGRMVQQMGASQVALISDSCYSGSLVSDERIRAVPGSVDPDQVLTRKTVVVMSSGGNEPVSDAGKQGHSPFAWNLMNTLGQMSNWQPGSNVFERVRFGVARELPQRPKYGAYAGAGHQSGGDYLFENRQLESIPN